jgi:pSer/pThr/pTyr-binding forkhead associated (FHA) protein
MKGTMLKLFSKSPLYTIHLSEETGVPPIPVYDKKIIIGRSANHVLAIPDNSISRNHVEIVYNHGVLTVMDMGSSNGTKINEHQIPANLVVEYHVGQVLTLGHCTVEIIFEFPQIEKKEE